MDERPLNLAILRTFSPLDGLKAENLHALARKTVIRELSAGRVLFKEGDPIKEGDPLYRIEKGLFQAAVEQAEGALARSKASKVLTEAQREAWCEAGPKVQSAKRLCQSGPLTGQQHFQGINSARAPRYATSRPAKPPNTESTMLSVSSC